MRHTVAATALLALTTAGCTSGSARPAQPHPPPARNTPGPQAAPDPRIGRGGPAPDTSRTRPAAPAPYELPRSSTAPVPVSQSLVRSTAGSGRTVALTFDDGPDPRWTPQILALLRQYDATSTFCIVGEQARAHPDLVRRIAAEGHRLCNHTQTHDEKLARLPASDVRAEIGGARDAILAAVPDAEIPWFRAPGGGWSTTITQTAASYGMKPLDWSVDSRDWKRPGAETILATITRELRPGAVILLHDAGGERSQTVTALARLLPWLIDQGYRFDTPA